MDATGFRSARVPILSLIAYHGIVLFWLLGPAALGCGQSNLSENSTFTSPGYPSSYYHNRECFWNIAVDEGYVAVIAIRSFRLERCTNCGCDYLRIYDGLNQDSPQLDNLCGETFPSAVYASQNRMYVKFRSDGSVNYPGFSATVSQVQIVNETIDGENGTIQSPNYPNNYEPAKRYQWRITVPEGKQINMTFRAFLLENSDGCWKDFVEIFYENAEGTTVSNKYCGSDVPKFIRTLGNSMLLVFQSDSSEEETGFVADYEAVSFCGGVLSVADGSRTIQTPNYPNNYNPVERCLWTINAAEDHKITMKFVTFEVAESDGCSKDFVEIFNGNATAPRLGRFCGSDIPNDTRTTTDQMTVLFTSDESGETKGFSASFSQSKCGVDFHSERGTFHSPNYPKTYTAHEMCAWKITVTEGYQIALRFDSFHLERSYRCSADAVTVYDGLNATSHELEKLCSQRDPRKVYSSGNTMSVRFTTDSAYEGSGFSATFLQVRLPAPLPTGQEPPENNTCQQDIKADTGTVQSPLYPQNYQSGTICSWKIEVPAGDVVRLQFHSFDLEDDPSCNFDNVRVRDGNGPYNGTLGYFCGSKDPETMWSTTNKMAVYFTADNSFESSGFSATFTKVDYKEESNITVPGNITSPNYPNNYGPAQKRVWNITVSSRYIVHLKFLTFNLEYSHNCTDDFVQVYFGNILQGNFCGQQLPPDIRSTDNNVIIVFASDTSDELQGFSAIFEKEAKCGSYSCRNEGLCRRFSDGSYKCDCRHGYGGSMCEEIVQCANDTCDHGGICFQNGTDSIFQCICSHGYEGDTCNERILCESDNALCQNGGYCTHGGKDGLFQCICEPGFEGRLCEARVVKNVENSGGHLTPILVPLLILLLIGTAVVVFLVRKRLRQQPYDNMKKNKETILGRSDSVE